MDLSEPSRSLLSTSILMTVHDREPEVLLACLRSLSRSAPNTAVAAAAIEGSLGRLDRGVYSLADSELIIVNDRSELDYSWIKAYAQPRFKSVKWVDTGDYPGFRINGYGNPAHAFNCGLALATGERLVVMSSDVIVTPAAIKSMDRFYDGKCLYTPRVQDMDRCGEYCGSTRPFPMPWMLAMPTGVAQSIGGWDEGYLDGLCFEDNDFVGRMALRLGLVRADWDSTVYHQSHPQPAYDFRDVEVQAANQRNRDYCKSRWGGIPFDGQFSPVEIIRRPDPAGCIRFTVTAGDELKMKLLGATK